MLPKPIHNLRNPCRNRATQGKGSYHLEQLSVRHRVLLREKKSDCQQARYIQINNLCWYCNVHTQIINIKTFSEKKIMYSTVEMLFLCHLFRFHELSVHTIKLIKIHSSYCLVSKFSHAMQTHLIEISCTVHTQSSC